ncbi:MAG: hypothetical protein EOP56_09325 [Sphingobacteriales bacterium]|nr:MAG: hypothetical protein EOP56_09325 [Sphingobacteriales bacterium]
MIQANELRLKNWVQDRDEYLQVVALDNDNAIVQDPNIKMTYELSKLSGIPLTHAILEAAGFENEDMHDLGVRIYTPISTETDYCLSFVNGTIWLEEHDTGAKYVHQLQNLYYSLTQTELQIKL